MADIVELAEKLRTLAPKVAGDKERLTNAMTDKAAAEGELLARVVAMVKPALPAICNEILRGNTTARGVALVPGKAGTVLWESGELEEQPDQLVRNNSLKSMLERLVQLLEAQKRDKAAEKAESTAAKVRLILGMLKEPL
jgi:hypothetical protein